MKVGVSLTGSAGSAAGGVTSTGTVVVVVGMGCHWAYNVSVPEFGNVYVSSPAWLVPEPSAAVFQPVNV